MAVLDLVSRASLPVLSAFARPSLVSSSRHRGQGGPPSMPSYRQRRFRPMSFQQTLATYVQGPGLPFHDALDEHVINRIAAEIQDEFDSTFGKVYTLSVVLWAFLTQVSAEDQSCRATVMRILAFRKRSAQP